MRKKVLAVVTAAVLALGCFATVSAANYDVTEDGIHLTYSEKSGTATVDGLKANSAQKKAIRAIKDNKIFSVDKVGLDYYYGNDDVTVTPVNWNLQEKFHNLSMLYAQAGSDKVVRVFFVDAPDADASTPVGLTLADSEIKAGKKYAYYHLNNTGEWDKTSAKVTSASAGLVKGEVTKASPFALVELTGSAAPEADKDAAAKGATGTKTAPKTGEV